MHPTRRTPRLARVLHPALCLFALVSAACARPDAAPKAVRLGYFANVTHAQAVLGVASGDFAKAVAPAKLTTRTFNAGPSLIEALFAGEIDIAYVGPSPTITAHAQSRGEGIRVLAGAAANGVVIVARPESGITSLKNLKGKRIATPQMGNTQDVSARHYLLKTLGQADATNVLPVPNAEQPAMMARGQIDAAWAVEPWGARLEAEAGAKVIAEEKEMWPNNEFTLTLVIASPKFLQDHPAVVESLLRAHCAWTAKLNADPQAQAAPMAEALRTVTGKELSQDIIGRALSRVTFTNEPLEASLKTFADWAFDLGFAKQKPSLKGLVDRRLLDKALAAAPAPAGQPVAPGAAR